VYSRIDGGTTIPPDVIDANWPLTTAPIEYRVTPC